MLVDATQLDVGLDQDLRSHVQHHHITEGRLFGMVSQPNLTTDERMQLLRAGWTARNFVDAPVMEPPMLDVKWDDLEHRHRDLTLHRVHHRLPENTAWAGNRLAILEEMLASAWDAKEEELRTLLAAFAYASVWNEPKSEVEQPVSAFETFFFYSDRLKNTMSHILEEGIIPPDDDDEFWLMLDVLIND